MTDKEWAGEERRAIPIHILNHMDARLEAHEGAVEEKLDKIQRQIQALSNSVNSWMEKEPAALRIDCERLIDELVPTHPDNPQATPADKRHEHRIAHARWIKRVDDEMKKWSNIRQEALKWAVIGALSVIVLAVWKYLLAGHTG